MLSLIDTRTTRVLFTVLLFVLALGFLYAARRTLVAFLFAIFFAYLVDPAVSRVEKWVRGRGRAIAAIYALLVILLITFFFFVGPRIAHQAQRLSEALPTLTSGDSFQRIADRLGQEHGWSQPTINQIKAFLLGHKRELNSFAQRAGIRLAEVAQQSWLLIVVPILAAFFLKDAHSFKEVLLSFVNSRPQRELVEGVLGDLNQMLAHFIRAQLTLAALSMLVYTTFMASTGVPYALVLGTAGGMMGFLSVFGPLVAAGLIIRGCLLLGSSPRLVFFLFLWGWSAGEAYCIFPPPICRRLEPP